MVKNILGNLTKLLMKRMGMVSNCGRTAANTKVFGKTTKLRVLEDSFLQMEMCIKENGSKTKLMAMVNIFMLKVQHTKAAGLKTNKKEMAKSSGQTIHTMKEAI